MATPDSSKPLVTKTLQQVQSEENVGKYDGVVALKSYVEDYETDLSAHDYYSADFDAYEAMVQSRTWDSVSKSTKSGITDGSTTTIYLERAARVVGQLPTGEVQAFGKKDRGKAALMDIILQRYIYPHATGSGWTLLEKIREWQFYSSVYGFMPMYYDWEVAADGYIGPNCYLWSPRLFIPQNGRSAVRDMDHVHGLVYMTPIEIEGVLEDLDDSSDTETDDADEAADTPAEKAAEANEVEPEEKPGNDNDDDDGWDVAALKSILNAANNSTHMKDTKRDTQINRTRANQPVKEVLFATRYEAGKDGHWITFCPEHSNIVVRDIPNPHKNGKIPFVVKHALPLFDSPYGLGDFQRAKPIQGAMDGLTNFYFQGIKSNIYQPIVVNANGVIKSTITQKAGAIMQETAPNSIRRLETSTAGLNTYQSAMTQMKGSLLNQAGTTDTTVSQGSALDPGFGKTPQALQALGQRESARDNQDRFFLEQALEELLNAMIGLIPNMATEAIPVNLFSADIQAIRDAGLTDVDEMLEESESGGSAKLTINPEALDDVDFRFFLASGSTSKADKQQQLAAVQSYIQFLGTVQNELTELRGTGKTVDWVYLSTMYGTLSDVPGLDKVFRDMTEQETQAYAAQAQPKSEHPKLNFAFKGIVPPNMEQAIIQQYGINVPDPTPPLGAPVGVGIPGAGGSPLAAANINGHNFNDPHIASKAQELMAMAGQQQQPQQQPQQPTQPGVQSNMNQPTDASMERGISGVDLGV